MCVTISIIVSPRLPGDKHAMMEMYVVLWTVSQNNPKLCSYYLNPFHSKDLS